MLEGLNGSTRLYPIVGDPVAQVKSPAGLTTGFAQRGVNAVCIPAHVAPADLGRFAEGLGAMQNTDGLVVTVPHKFAAYGLCATATARAHALGAVNVLRRNADRTWHGDMLDGLAFVQAQREAGGEPACARALLVGAGGAGTAIGLALVEAGVRELLIHDSDDGRSEALLRRLSGRGAAVQTGAPDPAGCDLVCNATPAGMRETDPLPVAPDRLHDSMLVGDVITVPELTPLLRAARAAGCRTATGVAMFRAAERLMLDFFLGGA